MATGRDVRQPTGHDVTQEQPDQAPKGEYGEEMKSDNMGDQILGGVATTIAESPKGVTRTTCRTGPQENAQRSLQRWRPMQLYSQPLETRTAETSIGPAPMRMCPERNEWVEVPVCAFH